MPGANRELCLRADTGECPSSSATALVCTPASSRATAPLWHLLDCACNTRVDLAIKISAPLWDGTWMAQVGN
jgi:hypothetical protein